MKLSTAGRYALRTMVDIAMHEEQGTVRRIDIAERQQVSEQYLAQLLRKLVDAQLVTSIRGPHGGYRLAYCDDQITAGMVMRAVDETLEPVFCVDDATGTACPRADGCPTWWLWSKLGIAINDVLDSVTLKDLQQHSSGL